MSEISAAPHWYGLFHGKEDGVRVAPALLTNDAYCAITEADMPEEVRLLHYAYSAVMVKGTLASKWRAREYARFVRIAKDVTRWPDVVVAWLTTLMALSSDASELKHALLIAQRVHDACWESKKVQSQWMLALVGAKMLDVRPYDGPEFPSLMEAMGCASLPCAPHMAPEHMFAESDGVAELAFKAVGKHEEDWGGRRVHDMFADYNEGPSLGKQMALRSGVTVVSAGANVVPMRYRLRVGQDAATITFSTCARGIMQLMQAGAAGVEHKKLLGTCYARESKAPRKVVSCGAWIAALRASGASTDVCDIWMLLSEMGVELDGRADSAAIGAMYAALVAWDIQGHREDSRRRGSMRDIWLALTDARSVAQWFAKHLDLDMRLTANFGKPFVPILSGCDAFYPKMLPIRGGKEMLAGALKYLDAWAVCWSVRHTRWCVDAIDHAFACCGTGLESFSVPLRGGRSAGELIMDYQARMQHAALALVDPAARLRAEWWHAALYGNDARVKIKTASVPFDLAPKFAGACRAHELKEALARADLPCSTEDVGWLLRVSKPSTPIEALVTLAGKAAHRSEDDSKASVQDALGFIGPVPHASITEWPTLEAAPALTSTPWLMSTAGSKVESTIGSKAAVGKKRRKVSVAKIKKTKE